jgi:hypothetical protein
MYLKKRTLEKIEQRFNESRTEFCPIFFLLVSVVPIMRDKLQDW